MKNRYNAVSMEALLAVVASFPVPHRAIKHVHIGMHILIVLACLLT